MLAYTLRRVALSIPTALMVSLIVFSLLYITPGDPASLMAGMEASVEEVEALREALGLKRGFLVRLKEFYWDLAHFDLGTSIRSGKPVSELIMDRADVTLTLALMMQTLMIVVGIPLGVLAGYRHNTWVDKSTMMLAVVGMSVPGFWVAFMAMWLVGLKLAWLPPAGYVPLSDGVWPFLQRFILPVTVNGVLGMAFLMRITRSSIVELMRDDFVRTARAKGVREPVVLFRHILKNATPPILTVLGLGFAGLVTGAVITEAVFALPGIGLLLASAISARDYPIIQGFVLLCSLLYVLVNLLVDISYAAFDPRIRY